MKKRDLFHSVMHHSSKSNDLFVYAHTVNGKTVISSSRANPFPPNQPEAVREMGISGHGMARPIDPAILAKYQQTSDDYCYSPFLTAELERKA